MASDLKNMLMVLTSANSKLTVSRHGFRRVVVLEGHVGRNDKLIKSCNAVFNFEEDTDKFIGMVLEVELESDEPKNKIKDIAKQLKGE